MVGSPNTHDASSCQKIPKNLFSSTWTLTVNPDAGGCRDTGCDRSRGRSERPGRACLGQNAGVRGAASCWACCCSYCSGRLVRFQGELGYGGHTREGEVSKENEESVVLHLLSSMFDSWWI